MLGALARSDGALRSTRGAARRAGGHRAPGLPVVAQPLLADARRALNMTGEVAFVGGEFGGGVRLVVRAARGAGLGEGRVVPVGERRGPHRRAAVGEAGAARQVERAVRERLLGPLCAGAKSCPALEADVHLFPNMVARTAAQVCAQVVLPDGALTRWQRTRASTEGLAAKLDAVATTLLGRPGTRVAVGAVRRGSRQGGDQALWLAGLMSGALDRAGAKLMKSRSATDWPQGAAWLLEGSYVTRREGNAPVIEVQFSARDRRGRSRTTTPVLIPEDAAPRDDAAHDFDAGALRLRLDANSGGRLCNGDQTHLRVDVPGPGRLYVFDLFGEHAMTLPPRDTDGPQQVVIGPLEIAPPPAGAEEAFEALFVPRGVKADWLARLPATQCRLSDAQRARLKGRAIPTGSTLGVAGFVVNDKPPCLPGQALEPGQVKAMLAAVPVCE